MEQFGTIATIIVQYSTCWFRLHPQQFVLWREAFQASSNRGVVPIRFLTVPYHCRVYITATSPEHWNYVSEGAETIVFSYAGPPHPQFEGTVLRLKKTTARIFFPDRMIAFQREVMERLIPPENLPRLGIVHLDKIWLEALAVLSECKRPQERRKCQMDVTVRTAILATNLVGNTALSVEIKPKWAFLPSSVHLSPATRPIKTRTCRFCMHSYLKSTNGEIAAFSYCPLDLFSGEEGRVAHAVHALWNDWVDTQGAINNLKIFSWGNLLKPAEIVDQNIFDSAESFASAVVPLLVTTPVLRILSKLQRSLDVLDIEGLTQLRRRLEAETINKHEKSAPDSTFVGISPHNSSSPEPSISEWGDFVNAYISSHDSLDHTAPATANLRYYTLAYLLSATFKDCSIILKLHHGIDEGHNTVTAIDLDPKSVDKLQTWEALDKEIVETYAGVEGKQCIDQWKEHRAP